MTPLILSALASAFIVSAIDELIVDLGKWRGLVALIFASTAAFVTTEGANIGVTVVTALAAAFLSLASTVIVGALMPTQVSRVERLPRRVPPL